MAEMTQAQFEDLVKRLGMDQKTAIALRNLSDSLQTSGTHELTASGAVNAGTRSVELNHATVAVVATMDPPDNGGLVIIKDTSATGTAAHTVTLDSGTFDGTNNKATLNALNEALVVFFDSAGNGTIVENVGTVALAAV